MTAERWHQVRDILYAASQMDGGSRASYLDEKCAADQALREEVEKLLAALEQSGQFLEPDAGAAPADVPAPRIGPYRILGEAGRGGMGVVYHAVRDDDYRQEVAIKLCRAGVEADFLNGRFRLERQALAMLNHPNVARLLDGGTTPDGRPYLVMEWVEGQPITEYCRTHDVTLLARLKLFLEVGQAVEHSHRNLVVHRDLKPSNILITHQGQPKLLDFGIAKIFSPEAGDEPLTLTLAGARLLTPDYASPEQVRGEAVTTATDVYSLGAVLYEILTGVKPLKFEARTLAEIERTVCTQEPSLPSAATGTSGVPARDLRGDLDNIAVMALQKEPQRRYGSVSQFCEDVRRYLDGLPVIARKDTFFYRAGKFAQRHRTGVGVAALVFIALAIGGVTTLWQARVATEQRSRAERRFNDVRKLANSFLFEFDDSIKNLPGSTPARSFIVKRALEYLDGLAAEGRGDRSLQMEIAAAYQRVGEVQGDPLYPNLGDSQGALASSRKALALREELSQADPGNLQFQLALASIHQQISDILDLSSDTTGAVQHSAKALAIYEALARKLEHDRKFQTDLVVQTYHHANLLRGSADVDGAVAAYTRAVALSERLVRANPAEPETRIHLATSLDGLGGALQDKGDTASALTNLQEALAIREELAASNPANAHYRRQLGFSHHNLGLSLVAAGELSRALEQFRIELSLFDSLNAADPRDAQARRNVSLAHRQIGDLFERTADLEGALAQYRQSLAIDRSLSQADPGNTQAILDLSFSEGAYGLVSGKLGNSSDALAVLRQAVARQELLTKQDPKDDTLHGYLANSYTRLAGYLIERGDTGGAADYYRMALAARLKLASKNLGSNANLGALADCYANLGKALGSTNSSESLDQFNKATELYDRLTTADTNNAQYRIRLADTLANTARLEVRIASTPKQALPLRREYWGRARSLYQRSEDLWLELDRAGKLTAGVREAPRQVARELTSAKISLAKLQRDR